MSLYKKSGLEESTNIFTKPDATSQTIKQETLTPVETTK